MSETAEFVWIKRNGSVRTVVYTKASQVRSLSQDLSSEPGRTLTKDASGTSSRGLVARCANVTLPVVTKLPQGTVLYRHPTALERQGNQLTVGPVFAILAGTRHFSGSRADFRDVLRTARENRAFIYVLPTECVSGGKTWTGYVRIGYKKWLPIPCPHPEAVYNRIPNRVLEVNRAARKAKETLNQLGVPMFNPGYFSKEVIYHTLRKAGLSHYLPRTVDVMTWNAFSSILREAGGVYLKPTGSSIGHGIMRVDRERGQYRVRVLKHLNISEYQAGTARGAWQLVQQHRIPGKYVTQQAIALVEWDGKPCDLRVLLQKRGSNWQVVGKGVRVAGEKSITTHVPAGGSIVALSRVLNRNFPDTSETVERQVESLVLACAKAIDAMNHGQIGEMSMDVGVDKQGHVWLFEANSKPMKFDEPEIRGKSLQGVVDRLQELRRR